MYENNAKHYAQRYKIDFIAKIYIWSIVLEPLLFFVVSTSFVGLGWPQNLSRFLQFFILIILGIRLLIHKNFFTLLNPFHSNYKFFYYYILFALVVGLYGIINGAYLIPQELTYKYTFLRPMGEYVILFYYFFYFVVLFRYFVKKSNEIDYFFKIFSWILFLSLFVGYAELLLINMTRGSFIGLPISIYSFGVNFTYYDVDRYLYQTVGNRFHGILGEPRDAFSFLILGLGMITLKDCWKNQEKLRYVFYVILIITIFLTQSFSGIIGLFFSAGLLIVYFLPKFINLPKLKRGLFSKFLILMFLIILGLIILGIIFIAGSHRTIVVYETLLRLYDIMQSGNYKFNMGSAPGIHVLELHMNNIYPVWHRLTEVLNFNIIPTIIGTGLGSSSIVNSIGLGSQGLLNPSANLIRTFFDTGIMGVIIFIAVFSHPFKIFLKYTSSKTVYKIFFWMLIILGSYFAHRSATPFIFLGIVLVVFEKKFSKISKIK